jgi:hypothetical protein
VLLQLHFTPERPEQISEVSHRHFDIIFALAKDLGAMIFNGSAMLDREDNVILDSDGEHDF